MLMLAKDANVNVTAKRLPVSSAERDTLAWLNRLRETGCLVRITREIR